MTTQTTRHRDRRAAPQHFDQRDRLILAPYAQLKAGRETRAALEQTLAHDNARTSGGHSMNGER
ncbi:hypothetical protein D3C84_1139820 [compost metagenome]